MFRAAGLYAGFAFVVLQLADIIIPALGLPDTAVTSLLILIAVGFPFVLIVSWYIEITPDGIRVTASISEGEQKQLSPGRIVDFAIIVIALGVGAMYVHYLTTDLTTDEIEPLAVAPSEEPATDEHVVENTESSIAVLPFENLSSSQENAYFAAGIHEDILNSLSRNPALIVTSRTSTLAFQGTKKPIAEIARELNVAYVMEGSVRRAGDRVRISVQLIEAGSDSHIWSEAFERKLDDVFAIQVEVAEQVAGALQVQFNPESQATPAAVDVAAYELFATARSLSLTREPDKLRDSVELYQRAINLAPDYSDAWAGLSLALSYIQLFGGASDLGIDHTSETAAQRAVHLDPESWFAHYAMGVHYGNGEVSEFRTAEKHFSIALEKNPNDGDLLFDFGMSRWLQGQTAASVDLWLRAYRRNPLSPIANTSRSMAATFGGDLDDAKRYAARALELGDESPFTFFLAGQSYHFSGEYELAARELFKAVRKAPSMEMALVILAQCFRELGDYETQAYWLDRTLEFGDSNFLLAGNIADNLYHRRELDARANYIRRWAERQPNSMVTRLYYPAAITEIDAWRAYEVEDLQTYRELVQRQMDERLEYIGDSSEGDDFEIYFWNAFAVLSVAINAKEIGDQGFANELANKLLDYHGRQAHKFYFFAVMAYAILDEPDNTVDALRAALSRGQSSLRLYDRFHLIPDRYSLFESVTNNVAFGNLVAQARARNEDMLANLRRDLPDAFPPEGWNATLFENQLK